MAVFSHVRNGCFLFGLVTLPTTMLAWVELPVTNTDTHRRCPEQAERGSDTCRALPSGNVLLDMSG